MNLTRFFDHWGITENPFRGEEARQDPVFMRLGVRGAEGAALAAGPGAPAQAGDGARPGTPPGPALPRAAHSDFEKIAGDFDRPSTSIVFGEKGSGKTAIRLQLAERVGEFNRARPRGRCLLVSYDDLNPTLDRFAERQGATDRRASVTDLLKRLRLVDHIDALLALVVPPLIDALLGDGPGRDSAVDLELGAEPWKAVRRLPPARRRDVLLLQAVYDRPDQAEQRTRRLRRRLRLPPRPVALLWDALVLVGWLPAAAVLLWTSTGLPSGLLTPYGSLALALAAAWLLVLAKRLGWDRLAWLRAGHRLRRQVRVIGRGDRSWGASVRQLHAAGVDLSALPVTDSDDQRYAMLERVRAVLAGFGYASLIVVIDRVDEPTLISGDPERMRAMVWPLLNNKFLQQPGVGIKMLLPIELRHALFRESAAFFQEARLDKQNLIERLSWTGSMLYDLCNARLAACSDPARAPAGISGRPVTLLDLFAEDVTRQDLVEALDQMHQPRDAFKLLYQCLLEHCSNVTEDQAQWRIPRLILETVKKGQAERVRQLYRGVRPA